MSSTHGSLSSSSTHNSISFLRSGFAKGKNTRKAGQAEEKEEWYIPYKGPYEPAPPVKTTKAGLKKRDSWGDPVPGVGDRDGVDSHQGGVDKRDQYGTAQQQQQRPRSQSHPSNQNQPNHPLSPRADYSTQTPKMPSYINLDAAGGVGNSPIPHPSSSRHMLHTGYGTGGMERPWSAREARGREAGVEGAEVPQTLRQRSSLASLFEKKYSLLKKLSLAKLGLGVSSGEGGKESGAPVDDPEQSGQPPRQRSTQPQHYLSPTYNDPDRRDGDITLVPRSPKTESLSMYSQPSPFVPSTQPPKSVQEEQNEKEWVPIVRLTPPPTVSALVDPPLTASTVSSFASKQRTLSSPDSYSHSRSNSHSQSQHSASAPAAVPLRTVDEDETHVESYYDMLMDAPPPIESHTTNDVDERHPYAYFDPVHSHRLAGMQKTRLSPIPQSRPSLTTMRSVASSPDLRRRGKESVDADDVDVGVDVSRLRPHVRDKLQSTGGRGKERWLSTDLIAIFLPKPKFKIKAKKANVSNDVGHDNHRQGAPSRGGDAHHMAEFGVVPRVSDVQEGSTGRRKSYAYDDLSLLSLDKVLEERDKLEQDRIKWQAQAVKSLGNRHARIVSRSRSKSLTQAGRKMSGQLPQHQQRHQHTRGQQSSIDYLAARACLGDQDIIPLVDPVVDIGPTARRPQFDFPKRHERMPSGSSGLATSSGGQRSSNGISAQSGSDTGYHHHKRNDSWSRSAVRIAKSVPQLCGVVKDDDDDQNINKRIQHQLQPQQVPEAPTPSDMLLTPIPDNENRKPSPSPSNTSGVGGLVGIAISTPPEAAYRDYHHHPYTIGANRIIDGSKEDEEEQDSSGPPDIRLLDHPYAQRGLTSSSISRCVAGEREPDYVGPHPAVAVPMTKELMADLGLSELSARHRLPPHAMLAHQPPPLLPPLIRLDSASQSSQSEVQALPVQEQAKEQPSQSSNQLYVKVDDTRNSYQDLQPYVRVDSDARPSDRLWVTYSPGTVREVMPNEVFQYSPFISNQVVAHAAAAATASDSTPSGPDPDPEASPVSTFSGTDFFLQRYQRMSTIYQDTVSMSQALGNAMYDSSSTQDAKRRERSRSADSGNDEERQQSTTTTTTTTNQSPEPTGSQEEQEQQLFTRYTATPPPRVIFGPRLNTTPPKHTTESGSYLSASRVSSPILPRQSPVVFTDPFPGRRGREAVSVASPENSSSGISTSPPTSPTVPRVGSPDNLEPFHGLFYRPPGGSETSDSPVPSPSPHMARSSDPDEEEEGPSHLLLDDDAQWIPRLGGSGLTTLLNEVNEVNDELEQMVLERRRDEQRERSGSIRSSNTLQSQGPSMSDSVSVSTSTTSKGGVSGEGGVGGRRSRRINTEAGPLDFVLDRSMLPQQDAPTTTYVPRPNRVSTFYPSTPIPEDIEFSRASSPFEGTVEDETVRVPVGSNASNPSNVQTTTTTTSNTSYLPAPPRSSAYPTEEEYMAMYYPEGMRASYLTTTDTTLSRISTLSDFPVPPNGMTPEEISILAAQPR